MHCAARIDEPIDAFARADARDSRGRRYPPGVGGGQVRFGIVNAPFVCFERAVAALTEGMDAE